MAPTGLLVGSAMIAFSPALALWIVLVARQAHLIVVAITAAVFWLLAVLIVAILWSLAPVLKDFWPWTVLLAAMMQEFARIAFVQFYRKVERVARKLLANEDLHLHPPLLRLNDSTSAVAGGLGFGLMHIVVMFGSVLVASSGPATLYSESCASVPLVVLSGLFALAFFLLDIVLMVLAFHAHRRRDPNARALAFTSHILMACVTIVDIFPNGCWVSIPGVLCGLVVTSYFTWIRVVGLPRSGKVELLL